MKKVLIGLALSGLLVAPVMVAADALDCKPLSQADCKRVSGCAWGNAGCTQSAAGTGEQPTETAPAGPQSGAELITLINNIGNWVFAGLLAVASLFLIYAGFMWITAGGDPQAATKARQMLTNALIGVVVALLARGLVQVIKSVIGG